MREDRKKHQNKQLKKEQPKRVDHIETFKEAMVEAVSIQIHQATVMEFNDRRKSPYYTAHVFVEGPSDVFVFKKNGAFGNKNVYFYTVIQNNDNENVDENGLQYTLGKDGVLAAMLEITAENGKFYPQHKEDIEKCSFIVDRDFDVKLKYKQKNGNYSDYARKRIQVTKYHSLESYFFSNENFVKVMNALNVPGDKREEIKTNLVDFAKRSIDYFLKKNIVSLETMEGRKDTNVFLTDGNVYTGINTEEMNKCIAWYDKKISKHDLQDAYQKLCNDLDNEIKKNPMTVIRGHTIYAYFEYLMKDLCLQSVNQNEGNEAYASMCQAIRINFDSLY